MTFSITTAVRLARIFSPSPRGRIPQILRNRAGNASREDRRVFSFDDMSAALATGNHETPFYAARAGATSVSEPSTLIRAGFSLFSLTVCT
jgi:hypothetical protein